jgi:hypothetical protein
MCEVRIVICRGQEELRSRWLVLQAKFAYICSYATSKYFMPLSFVFSCSTTEGHKWILKVKHVIFEPGKKIFIS